MQNNNELVTSCNQLNAPYSSIENRITYQGSDVAIVVFSNMVSNSHFERCEIAAATAKKLNDFTDLKDKVEEMDIREKRRAARLAADLKYISSLNDDMLSNPLITSQEVILNMTMVIGLHVDLLIDYLEPGYLEHADHLRENLKTVRKP